MPQITLDLVSLDGKPLSGLSRRFEGEGGTIGRDEGNTLALPDSSRRVSRLHAAVSFPGGVPTITNSSAVLPISVGGLELECGQAMPLLPGMHLEIGPYVLAVRAVEAPAPVVPMPAQSAAPPLQHAPATVPATPWAPPPGAAVANLDSLFAVPAPSPGPAAFQLPESPGAVPSAPAAGDPFADLLAGLGPATAAPSAVPPGPAVALDDPLAGLFGPGALPLPRPPAEAAAPDPFAALGLGPDPGAAAPRPFDPGSMPPSAPPAAVVIPEDFNPFDLPSASQRNTADPLASLMDPSAAPTGHALTGGEQSIDVLFASTGASGGLLINERAGEDLLGGSARGATSLLESLENSNPLALFGDAPAPDSQSRPMRDDLAEVGGAYQPPRALDPAFSLGGLAPPPPSLFAPPSAAPVQNHFGQPPPAPALSAAMPSYPGDELTRAFLAGANLPPSALPQGLTPEIMAVVGRLLHSATAGAIGMLAVRANIKREVQANVTIISSEANNPLKFLPDADTVLQQLLGKKIPGFMGPDEAMMDAFNDLRAHELGVIAGTRAALGEVLGKFDPAVLSDRLVGGSLLERALPAVRKTKLWDLYLERYAHIRREAEDDFQSIFGKAFVEAYEHETARMKARPVRAPQR